MKQTEIFHVLSDETRLRALLLMSQQGQLCVCELVYALGLSQPKISRHMAVLRDVGLLTSARKAQWVFYDINENLPAWQQQVLHGALEGIGNETIVQNDLSRLSQMKDRPQRDAA